MAFRILPPEYRSNKRPFRQVHRVSPGRQSAVNWRLKVVSAVIGPGGPGEFPHISASGDFSRHRHEGERAASLGFAASQWHEVDHPNTRSSPVGGAPPVAFISTAQGAPKRPGLQAANSAFDSLMYAD